MKNEVCPCHSSQFVLASLYSRAPVRSQWRKVCRITVQTHPRIQTALANRQAVPNRQACRAMGTALTRMSRTSIAVTTGIGITATGIGESGARAAPVGCRAPLGSMGRFRSERSIEHRVIRATTGGATPRSRRWFTPYFGLPSHDPRQPFSLGSWSGCQPGTLTRPLSFS